MGEYSPLVNAEHRVRIPNAGVPEQHVVYVGARDVRDRLRPPADRMVHYVPFGYQVPDLEYLVFGVLKEVGTEARAVLQRVSGRPAVSVKRTPGDVMSANLDISVLQPFEGGECVVHVVEGAGHAQQALLPWRPFE